MEKPTQRTHYRGDGFAIVSVEGFDGPVVALDAGLVKELGEIWHAAHARLAATFPGQGFDAMRDLCAMLRPIFKHYGAAMIEHAADKPLPPELSQIQRDIDELQKLLEDFDPDNWPGGGRRA